MSTCFGTLPVIVNPPMPTLFPVSVRMRVERFNVCEAGVAVGVAVAVAVALGVAVAVAVAVAVGVAVAVAVAVGVGAASSLVIVPCPCPSAIVALLAFIKLTKNVSLGSKLV